MFAESKGGPATDTMECDEDKQHHEQQRNNNSYQNGAGSTSSINSSSNRGGEYDFKADFKSRRLSDRFHVGQKLDVLDSRDCWSEAEVLKVDDYGHQIYITFTYWESKWDEWITNVYQRTAPLHTHTYYDGGTLKTGQRIDCFDHGLHRWLEAFVIGEDESSVRLRDAQNCVV